MTDDLAPRLSISECVRVHAEATAEIRDAFRRLAAAEKRLNDVFECGHGSIHVGSYDRRPRWDAPDDALEGVDRDVWRALVDRLELRRMMSIQRWEALTRQVEKGDMPPITEESVTAVLRGFQESLPEMLGEAVEEVFDWLRPRRSKYKSNSEFEVPEKIVLGRVVDQWGWLCSSWRINHHVDPQLTALENVFTALDGKGQITKGHYSAISQVIRAPGFDGTGETEYFRFKTFRNGNMHLWFKRKDLLARFNAIAGGKRLRQATEAA